METESTTAGKTLIWRYDKLVVISTWGESRVKLSELDDLLSDKQIEFSRVRKTGMGHDTAAAYHDGPPAFLSFTRRIVFGETSMIFYGLEEKSLRKLMKQTTKRIGLSPAEPSMEEIERHHAQAFDTAIRNYKSCLGRQSPEDLDFKLSFSAINYAEFLHRYKNVEFGEAKRTAIEKFAIRNSS